MNMLQKRCSKNHWEGRAFCGGSDEKMRRLWLGREIVAVGLPPLVV